MQIELETLPNCITAMRVELPPDRVDQERKSILREYQSAARLPGFHLGAHLAHDLMQRCCLARARHTRHVQTLPQALLTCAGTRVTQARCGTKSPCSAAVCP